MVNRPRPGLTAASGFVLIAALGLWIAEGALSVLPTNAADSALLLNALYYLPFVLLPLALYALKRRGLYDALRLNPLPFGTTLLLVPLAVLSVFAVEVIDLLWTWLLSLLGVNYALSVPIAENSRELIGQIIMMAAFPAVCEELLFRGFVLSAWETRGTRYAIGVTAALFMLLHGNILGLPVYLALGLMIGYLVYALDSIYAGIVFHTVYNAACLVIPYLLQGSGDMEAAAGTMPEGGALALSVGLEFALILAMMAMLLNTVRLRSRLMGVVPIPCVRRPLSLREKLTLAAAVAVMVATNVIIMVMNLRAVAQMGGAL